MLVKKLLRSLPVPPIPQEHIKKAKAGYLAMAKQHGEVLSVSVYEFPEKKLALQWFSDGINSIKYKDGAWETASIVYLLMGPYAYSCTVAHEDEESNAVAERFFEENNVYTRYGNILRWCDEFDKNLRDERRKKTANKEWERMQNHFAQFPEIPQGVTAFADKKMNQFLFFSKIKNGKRTVRCSACGKTYTVGKDVPKHKTQGVCRRCKQQAIWRAMWLGTPKTEIVSLWLLQRKDGDLYWRISSVARSFDDNFKKTYCISDSRRMYETWEKNCRRIYNYGFVTQGYYWGCYWKRFKSNEVYEKEAWIYPETLNDAIGPEYHHVSTDSLAAIDHPADLYFILLALRENKNAEYFAKAGMWRLLQQMARLSYTVEIPSHLRRLARKYDIDIYELKTLEKVGVISDDRFEAVRKIRDGRFGSAEMIGMLGIDRYIRNFGRWYQQTPKEPFYHIEQWYTDYLNMCEELNVDLSNKSVRYPRNLKDEHDRLASRIKEMRAEEENEYFQKKVQQLYRSMQAYTDEEFTVVFPQKRTDLIAEGQSLNHCVGGKMYADLHLQGVKMIFFIRAVAEPDKPLYTLQANVVEGTIVQLYGYGDKPAPKKVHAFCKDFIAQLYVKEATV